MNTGFLNASKKISMISEELKNEILSRVDIIDIISSCGIEIKRKGNSHIANCPFHDEKTGSFTIWKQKNMYKCFGCGKTGDAITFLMEYDKISYIDAVKRIANYYHIQVSDDFRIKENEPKLEKVQAQDELSFEKKQFTAYELSLLGKDIKAETCEKDFSLFSLNFYITKKNKDGVSYKISSTDTYPIYVYDYGTWGKIYQPLYKPKPPHNDDFRFTYWGTKPESYIFSDTKTAKLIANARKNILPTTGDIEGEDDNRVENLIICSGGSDAINVFSNGYNVCWLNSETADLEDYEYNKILKPICKNLYLLYDLDETGIRQAQRIALKFLKINIIWLPEDLKRFKDRKGKTCKDVKDFFLYFKSNRHRNLSHYFRMIVQTSLPLCFWQEKFDKKNEFTGYDINNEQLYGFLSAKGLHTMDTTQEKKGFKYVHIDENIVKEVAEEQLQSFVNHMLINFIRENIEYFNINLLNAIHRSNQVKLSSLEKIRRINVNFKSYGPDFDFMFFNNTAVRISNKGIETVQLEKINSYVYDFKIIDHDFKTTEAPFNIEYTDEYKALLHRMKLCDERSNELMLLKKELDNFNEFEKFKLSISDKYKDFSFLKYIYNTGKIHWKKREANMPLTPQEEKEEELHFINKAMAIGYMIYRYKDPSRAYMVYGMETEQSSIGKHLGGTGKSLFFSAIEKVRKVAYIDGQKRNIQDNETLFSDVRENITEFVYFDDLNKGADLHLFMPMITGKMIVRALYMNSITLDFDVSPKFGVTSNHAINNFDASLRRRTWFIAFSNYYHSEDKLRGIEERSPRTEFGKNLLLDYTDEEMNMFYNFMAFCLLTYLQFRVRINPPMDSIEKRNIQRILGDEFILWAEDYLTSEKLNVELEKNELLEAYKKTMPVKFAEMVKMRTFKEKLQMYCEYKGYIFNPHDLLNTDAERERNEIRMYKEGKDLYFFHIRTTSANHAPHNHQTVVYDIDGVDELFGQDENETNFSL